ncbi:MAG: HEAT repeat domain-containing protein [Candidatus Hodarchaeota archaeon]
MSELEKLLEDGEIQKALELVNEDDDAWEDLLEFLEGSDEAMQRLAFEVVSQSGDHPRLLEALPMLISGLNSDNEELYRYAAEALYFLGSDAVEAADSLSSLLSHDDDDVRRAVARVFTQMGSGAIEAKDALIDALTDSDEVVRGEAALALGNLGPDVPEAVPKLIALLTDEEEFLHDEKTLDVRTAAKTALEQIGTSAISNLLEVLRADRAELRAIALLTLSHISNLPEDAVKDIEEAILDPDEIVQSAARKALKKIKVEKQA